jgi:hypothetical protein
MRASPMTTGEIAKGRSIRAFRNHLPLNLSRTSTSAQATPKIVFSGIATATMIIVSQKACIASGVVSVSSTLPTPSSNALATIMITGIRRRSAR